MNLLSIETSTKTISLCFSAGDVLIAEHAQTAQRPHSESLMGILDGLLNASGVSVSDLDGIAVGLGPGSFTGLRIGVSCAKGLSLALGKPCCGVSSLDALAFQCAGLSGIEDAAIYSVIGARNGRVYCAEFVWEGGAPRRMGLDRLLEARFLAVGEKPAKKRKIFVGDGADLCYTICREEGVPSLPVPDLLRFPRAYGIFRAARGGMGTWDSDAGGLAPIYLRPPQCEQERLCRGGVLPEKS